MANGDYMRLAHGGCSLPVSAANTRQPTKNRPTCSQCGAARSRTKPHEVSVLCRDCYRKSVGYVAPVVRRCLWCLATYVPKDAKVRLGKSGGWFCSRECSFADRALHGEPGGGATRSVWRNYGRQFEAKQIRTATCGDCGAVVNAHAKRCADCNRLRNNRKTAAYQRTLRSVVRQCPCCLLMWSAIGKAGPRLHCFTSECDQQFLLHVKAVVRAAKAVRRARERGVNSERFDPIAVLARDRWRCQLCGVKTPQAKRGSIDDNAPELDHIVPLSKGGGHTQANTQCLCRRCNGVKSDAARGQLGLGW